MHDQLSFTEVPANKKKLKKLCSKKLVEIKTYFQLNFKTWNSCPYGLRFFVPQLRGHECKIPMGLWWFYTRLRKALGSITRPRIKTTVLFNMLPLKCCRLYCRLVLICRPTHYILLSSSIDSLLVFPNFFFGCVVRFFVFMEKNVLLRNYKTVRR